MINQPSEESGRFAPLSPSYLGRALISRRLLPHHLILLVCIFLPYVAGLYHPALSCRLMSPHLIHRRSPTSTSALTPFGSAPSPSPAPSPTRGPDPSTNALQYIPDVFLSSITRKPDGPRNSLASTRLIQIIIHLVGRSQHPLRRQLAKGRCNGNPGFQISISGVCRLAVLTCEERGTLTCTPCTGCRPELAGAAHFKSSM